MSRVRTFFAIVLPSAVAGGFLFASPFGHAETGAGGSLGFWPSASDTATGPVIVAQADPRPPRHRGGPLPPAPPAPPAPPMAVPPPVPPAPPPPPVVHIRGRHGHGVSVSIHDGKIEVDGIAELVQEQLDSVSSLLDNLHDVPPDVRDRLRARIKAVRERIGARLSRLRSLDLDKLDRLGPEVERLGDEIEKDMEGIDKDLAQLGDKLGKGFAKKFSRDFARSVGPGVNPGPVISHGSDDADDDDDDDDDAVVMPPNAAIDVDPSDIAPAIAALKDLGLDAGQREQLAKLRADSDRQIAGARREIEQMSNRLHDALLDSSVSEAEIARQIDSISQREATIRKARILTWVKARNLLRKDQVKKVEAATRNH